MMKKYDPFAHITLDPEEQELLRSFEAGEWKPIKNMKREMQKVRQAARYTVAKKKQVNIRLPVLTLARIKTKAALEGIPYQTLIGSVLHKYALGLL